MRIFERIVLACKENIFRVGLFPLLVIAVSFIGIYPLLASGYINTDDTWNHLNRLIVFDQALREGDLYPRWFPELALGYGYPVLNYYAPLSYYITEFFHLVGFGLYDSLKLTLAISFALSGLAMYLWMVEAFGSRHAALLAAIGYMYFPYRMTDIYVRGALAECVALTLLPFLLWSTFKSIVGGSRGHTILAGVFFALLVISHNVTALFFIPVWLGYAGLLLLFGPGQVSSSKKAVGAGALRVGVSFLTGLALSSFYWLPALQEQIYVSTDNFKVFGADPVQQLNAYSDLIQTSWIFDYIQRPPRVGLIQLSAFIIGTVGLLLILPKWKFALRPERSRAFQGLFFVSVVVIGIVMMSPAGIPIWETVPLVSYIQFPYRLLGFIGLGTGFVMGVLALSKRFFFLIGLPAVILLIFSSLAGLPISGKYLSEEDLTVPETVRFEADTGTIGSTAYAEYLPIWAKPGFSLPDDSLATQVKNTAKPASALNVMVQEARHNYFKLTVSSDKGGPLLLHQFFFPGWQARVDGKDAKTYPSTLMGLVTTDIPQGKHEVEMYFDDSGVRNMAGDISLLAFAGLVVGYLITIRRSRGVVQYSAPVFSAAVGVFYFVSGIPSIPQTVTGNDLGPYSFRSESLDLNPLHLSGYEVDSRKAVSDRKVRVVLYWQSLGKEEDSWTRMDIKDATGKIVGSRMSRPIYGTGRTYLWNTDELVKDEILVPIETSIEPGRYTLEISTEVQSQDLASAELGALDLPRVDVDQSTFVGQPVNVSFDDKVELLGLRSQSVGSKDPLGQRTPLYPGDTIDLSLFWKSLQDMDTDYSVFLHLLDMNGKRWAQIDTLPRSGFSPTSLWLKGSVVNDRYLFRLPEDLPMGVYKLDMGLYYYRTMQRLPINGSSSNTFTLLHFKVLPKVQGKEVPAKSLDSVLGDSMRLIGASINNGSSDSLIRNTANGNKLHVKLFWRAERYMDEDYTVFVHVLDSSGKVVAQIDSQPMGGAYPTSFWSPGEEVLDDYDIILPNLPPGNYDLRAGAYLLQTMTRLTTDHGNDNVTIGSLRIEGGD